MKKIFFILFIILACLPELAKSQSYTTTVGLRLVNDQNTRMIGFTAQQRLMPRVTFEGIVQSDFKYNTTLHGLIKRHHPFLTKRLNLYSGVGMSVGTEQSVEKNPDTHEITNTYGNKTVGADVIVGIEVTLLTYGLSIDYKPNINLVNRSPWYLGQVGISVRSVVVKGNQKNKKKRKRQRARRQKDRQKQRDKKRSDEKPWFERIFEKK